MALNLFKKKKNHRQRRQLIAHQQPKSPISEQYRNIRTNIEFAAVDTNLHSLMVTSANPSEGRQRQQRIWQLCLLNKEKSIIN